LAEPFHNKKRMNLINNAPAGYSFLRKQFIHKLYWTVVRARPATLKGSCVVEDHNAARCHEPTPICPVAANTVLCVVAIDKQEVNRAIPFLNCFKTEALYPNGTPPRETPPTRRRAVRFVKFSAGIRLRWKGSIKYNAPSAAIRFRKAIADTPSATPISTIVERLVAHFSQSRMLFRRVLCENRPQT
jgi:hypothetical protein